MSELSSVSGFDIGSENCYTAVARQGGIEIVLNEDSQRSTPAFVCLGGKQREFGTSAKQKHLMNLSNTYFAIKRLVGRQYNEVAQSEKLPFPIEQSANGEVAVRVWISGEETTFTATQLLGMLMSKLRQISGMAVDCVLSCPSFFSDGQRQAFRDAALISGLNPLRILNDMTAVGINYAFYRLANVTSSDDIAIVAFVDIGNTTTQCAVILFDTKKNLMQVLSSEYESNLGGSHFDELIAEHFMKEHKLELSKRSKLRLIAECEKLKKQMSANSNNLPISVECLYDDRDFSSRMSRDVFEKLCEPHFQRIEGVFRRALETAKQTLEKDKERSMEWKLHAVEIVGGSSRIPIVKRLIKETFGLEPSTTLNADEAVCRGCALQSAMLSPSFRVAKDLQVIDFAPYQINCKYWHATIPEGKTYSVNPLFSRGDQMPFTRQISVNCHSLPMVFELEYVTGKNTVVIGQYKISSLENLEVKGNKLRVRVRLDPNGFVYVSSAVLVMEDNNVKDEIDNKGDSNDKHEMDCDQQHESSNNVNSNDTNEQKKEDQKPKTKNVELQVEPLWTRGKLVESELMKFKEIESNLVLADRNWKERIDAKNELEEYVYEWRDKIEEGRYDNFLVNADRQSFFGDLRKTEEWLYADEESGEIGNRSLYNDKLEALKKRYSKDIQFRVKEYETRGAFLEDLGKAIQMGQKLLESKDCTDESKVKKLNSEVFEAQKWFDNCHSTLSSQPLNVNPSITTKQIQEQTNNLQSFIRPMMEDIHRKRQEEERKRREAEEKLKKEKEANEKKENSSETSAADGEDVPMDVDSNKSNDK